MENSSHRVDKKHTQYNSFYKCFKGYFLNLMTMPKGHPQTMKIGGDYGYEVRFV